MIRFVLGAMSLVVAAEAVPVSAADDRADEIARIIAGAKNAEAQPVTQAGVPTMCDDAIANSAPQVTTGRVAGWYGIKKGEYETTDAYLKRSAKWLGDGRIIASSPMGTGEYDADKQELTLPSVDMVDLGEYQFLPVTKTTRLLGSFVGQNAYGVKARVSRYVETQFGVAWKIGWSELGRASTTTTLHVAVADAPNFRKHLRFLIAGEASPPYVLRDASGHSAYINNPVELTTYSYAIVAMPVCAAIYDSSTRRVLSSWPLTATP